MATSNAASVDAHKPTDLVTGSPVVVADDVNVIYRIYADRNPMLRKAIVGGGRRREYRAVHAVRGVSFIARQGEAIGIVGHNGSGKSTLLRAIAGLQPTSSGNVYVKSTPVLLGVAAALQPELSGRRNVILGATALGMRRAEAESRLDDILEFAGVEEFADLPLHAFSSGMRSRLQFSIATAVTPEILMVDEALSAGDAEFKDRADARIREMLTGAGTIFLVSHSLGTLVDVCTRVLWIDHGKLVADGEPQTVVAAYEDYMHQLKKNGQPKQPQPATDVAEQ